MAKKKAKKVVRKTTGTRGGVQAWTISMDAVVGVPRAKQREKTNQCIEYQERGTYLRLERHGDAVVVSGRLSHPDGRGMRLDLRQLRTVSTWLNQAANNTERCKRERKR